MRRHTSDVVAVFAALLMLAGTVRAGESPEGTSDESASAAAESTSAAASEGGDDSSEAGERETPSDSAASDDEDEATDEEAVASNDRSNDADTSEEEGESDSTSSAPDIPSAREVMDKLDDLYRSDASHATMKMIVKKPRNTRKLTLESWSKGDEHMLVVIREPAREAGTATLRTPDGLWNYLPRADRLMRIPSGLLSDSWMGSHFSNDDLMRETRYDEDYEGELEATTHNGREAYKLTLTPKPDAPVVYSKLVFYVGRDDWIPLEQQFYDGGEVVRTMEFANVETVAGRKIPLRLTLRPSDADGEYTRMTYEDLEFDVDLGDSLFSRRGLRRKAE